MSCLSFCIISSFARAASLSAVSLPTRSVATCLLSSTISSDSARQLSHTPGA
eukprot:CAMPEP_0114321832 /NCGR_PEP_ID=MMETSP0059-20121206/26846_1 /TAXON_ID=36894 /ORGANISM="Pyramimonas parkeae, Strain CCMP726" /LENGTH=51 /DNA_ID=CAMNT_0001449655 /DNA_START=87 /DNA_END=239 /DNA_ORIENTATION=+